MESENKKMRYSVVSILTGGFGDEIFATNDQAEAKKHAKDTAYDYYYGTAIIDHVDQMADLGDRVVSISKAFQTT